LEKRPVYAQAQADQPWLVVGPVECRGSKAVIPLNVAQVPAFPGQTIHAQLSVQANGKQSFKIPVRLHVGQPGSGGAKALKNSGQHAPHLSEAPVTSLPARAETVVVESASRSFAKVPVSPLPPLPPLPDQSTAGPGLEPIPLLEARVDSAGARSRRRLALVCLLLSFLLLVSAAALAAWKILIKDREGTVPALVGPSS
jgi:hypothetical protein